jgi:ubiquinone/menaquinone biosynthesis C-methylase UbiE
MKTREEKINDVISLFDKHIRGAGDVPGVIGRTNDYMTEFIDHLLQKDWNVLDCGAGDGITSDYLQGKVSSWVGINKGIDLTNNINKYNIKEMDFHFLEFEDNYFDLVLAVNVLEHSYFPAMMLYEIRRVSKEYIFIDLPLSMSDGGSQAHQENPDHHYLMTKFMWKKMFNVIGLQVIRERNSGAEVQWLLRKCEPAVAC